MTTTKAGMVGPVIASPARSGWAIQLLSFRRSSPRGLASPRLGSRETSEGGFTLIEVLVSLALFALAAVVLSVAYLNIISSYRTLGSRHQAEEDWKLLRAVVLTEADREKVEEGGRIALPDGAQLNWKGQVEPTVVADLFRLTLVADATTTGEMDLRQRRQVIHMFRPSWSDPGEREQLREITRQRVAREEPQP